VKLGTRAQLLTATDALYAEPLKGSERVAALKLRAALVPDEDYASVLAEVERIYPALRGTRVRLQALALASTLLAPSERSLSLGEQVLLEMAGDA
jgi:hypothetical protein